jgi:hypothetical protein
MDIGKEDWPIFCQSIEGHLDHLDAIYTKNHVPISDRAELARNFILEHCLSLTD